MPTETGLSKALIPRLPFFYGWIILACVCCAGFARQGPAVGTLSIFIAPMTAELDWSRTAVSGAVSLGGILAAIVSPFLGPLLDRHGARVMLSYAVLSTAVCIMLLSVVESLVLFYLLFCIARMNFAGPFDLGIYGALNNWFIRRRPTATSVVTLFQMVGLTAMPLIATLAMVWFDDWRPAWVVVGLTVVLIGFIPNWLLMVRRPEDVGLRPDGEQTPADATPSEATEHAAPRITKETNFTRSEALRTPAFWLLSLFTLLVFPVQAGISLHQAPHLIERGLDPTIAATIVSTFSIFSAITGLAYGAVARLTSIPIALASAGFALGLSAYLMIDIETPFGGYVAAALFGTGIGGLITVLPIAWADFFGRRSFGAIRGIALTVQVLAQAAGPLLSGILRDLTGTYTLSLEVFAICATASVVVALIMRPPSAPARS